MSKLDLARLKSLHAAATQGEWVANLNTCFWEINSVNAPPYCIGDTCASCPGDPHNGVQEGNAKAICALHNAAPSLIERAELLEEIMEWLKVNGNWDFSPTLKACIELYAALETQS